MTHAWEKSLGPEALALLKQCRTCGAKCCHYITLELDDPGDDPYEYEAIRWYLTRPDVRVYVEDGQWFLELRQRCRFLQNDWTCGIYATRPEVCADHDPKQCEFWEDPSKGYELDFRSFEAFDAWYQKDVKPRLLRRKEREAARRRARARKAAKARWAKARQRG